ncbi:DinB family protein [Terrabacter lapilli]|uniref:DinB family protein n=1 Tax=Terrabacter lapilli TaxID=436231 RepID=A0ABN2S3H3_9MICO
MADETYDDRQGERFERARLTGATFEDVYLDGARFHDVVLSGASLRMVDLRGLRARDVWLEDVEITGDIGNLTINGVDVAPLVEAELDRRHPDRPKMRPTDAAGYREGWDVVERLWAQTVQRARTFPPELLHERVDGEWSFIETLRHLVFATDAWVRRALLGDPEPWHPLDLPHDDMPDSPPVPRDREARPGLDEVLALRADRMATVRRVVDELTDEALAGSTEPVLEPGYPEPESFPVSRVLGTILNEEWQHRLYAERDLDVLAARTTG